MTIAPSPHLGLKYEPSGLYARPTGNPRIPAPPRGFCPHGEAQQQGCLLEPGHTGEHLPSDPPEATAAVHPPLIRQPRPIDTSAAFSFEAAFTRRERRTVA